jgi:predicted esterase
MPATNGDTGDRHGSQKNLAAIFAPNPWRCRDELAQARDIRRIVHQISIAMRRRPRSGSRTLLLAASAWLAAALWAPAGVAVPVCAPVALDVPGFLPALLLKPSGRDARPLLVAAHGAGGSPEWECDYWTRLLGERWFVLCLRGTSLGKGGGYYFKTEFALEAELVAAERAARAHEPRIAATPAVYAGFSQGASFGSAVLSRHGADFSRLVLIEGFQRWNIPRARAFAKAGGKRVLFACGTKECSAAASESVRWLVKSGVDAKLEHATGAGHTPLGEVGTRVQHQLPWLLAP